MKKSFIPILVSLFVLTGCAKLEHLDELLTLKGVSDEQLAQNRYVAAQDQKFELLVKMVKADQMKSFVNRKQILRKFGSPVYREEIQKDGKALERLVYRYATRALDSDKVLIDFNQDGKLIAVEYISAVVESPHATP